MQNRVATTPEPTETIVVSTRSVACDGGGDALGHPRVFLLIPTAGPVPNQVMCPYCSRLYVLGPAAGRG